jgi:hypothetical protein
MKIVKTIISLEPATSSGMRNWTINTSTDGTK